jgi:hypothetical protein
MLNPLQENIREVLVLRVDRSNLTSLVEQQVQNFLRNSKRTCDKYKKIIPTKNCYDVATRAENKNTLFLIPDIKSQGKVQEADRVDQAIEDLIGHEISHEFINKQEVE